MSLVNDKAEEGLAIAHQFRQTDLDTYELSVTELGESLAAFSVRHLHREREELFGEVTVECWLAGALTYDRVLSMGKLNLSSQRARSELAGYLAQRAKTNELDWRGLLDEFAQRVLSAERKGSPAIDLRTIAKPDADESFSVNGWSIPRRHPTILFGDGGTGKSYLLLHFLGSLANNGLRVGLADWELAPEEHRDRLERLFGKDMPPIAYMRCEKPLVYESDRIRKIAKDLSLDLLGYDSVAFACDGPPEAAEVAGRYFRAVRHVGVGSLHIAHINKSDTSDQKPFGSSFWHNGARSTWFAKLAEGTPGDAHIEIGLYNRKANLGPLSPAVGLELNFHQDQTSIRRIALASVPDLASKLPLRLRMLNSLKSGAMSAEELAEASDSRPDTIRRTALRYASKFVLLPGGLIGIKQ